MRTNIEIDDTLMHDALEATRLPTKRAAVEAGLRLLVRLAAQREVLDLAGQVHWDGDLAASREGHAVAGVKPEPAGPMAE